MEPDPLRIGRAQRAMDAAAVVHELLAAGRGAALPIDGGLSEARADELIEEVRAGRA